MITHYLKIIARSALIFSESPRTGQQHHSLDYVPGTALWGALASRLYESGAFPEDMLWHLLHSEACQLGNGYPAQLTDDALHRTLPVSSAWTMNKYAEQAEPALYNLAQGFPQLRDGQAFQPKKLSASFVGEGLQLHKSNFVTSVKTAINRDTKTAQEGQLYGYQAIPSGVTFVAAVRFDEQQIEAQLQDAILRSLSEITHLGRSRSGEFGEVAIEILGQPEQTPAALDTTQRLNVLWCLSDVYLPNGLNFSAPLQHASSEDVDNINIDWAKSVITRRQVRLFNRARGGFDSTLDVIEKGSVIVLEQPIAHGSAQYISQSGLGRMRQCGFGEVMFVPPWYAHSQLSSDVMPAFVSFKVAQASSSVEAPAAQQEASAFIHRLTERSEQRFIGTGANRDDIYAIVEFMLSARRSHNIPVNKSMGPSTTQWRNVLRMCEFSADNKALNQALFGEDGLISKATKNHQWQITNKQGTTLADYLKDKWHHADGKGLARTIKLLAMLNPAIYGNLVKASQRFAAQAS